MKPLIVLLSTFVISLLILKLILGDFEFAMAGRIAMSVMLVFTAIAHYVFTKGMSMMLPSFIRYKSAIVYFTGIIELAGAIGLFIPSGRVLTGWLLIAFFILILPANIYGAIKHLDYQKGTFNGKGISYLWFRIPLQILFIAWTYYTAILF